MSGKVSRVGWVLLILVVVLAAKAAQSLVAFKNQDTQMAMFSTVVDDSLGLANLPSVGTPPYIRGKLVTVDVEKRTVDSWTYPKLSESLRAASPDEVGTAALITWGARRVGTYVDRETNRETGEAFVSTAELALVDVVERRVVGRAAFEGDQPAGGLTREGGYRSERPMFKIVAYLEQLPRK